jgi:hypothetical protein
LVSRDGVQGMGDSTFSCQTENTGVNTIFSRWSYNLYIKPGIYRKPIDSKKSFIDVSIFRNEIPCGDFKTQIEYSEPGEIENYREYRVLCKSW